MEALDGNAIAGPLFAYFGAEMTTVTGVCGDCGTGAQIAELRVYPRAPGAVVRCRHCDSVVMVIAEIRGRRPVQLDGFELVDPPGVDWLDAASP
jgi:hypothetical protein